MKSQRDNYVLLKSILESTKIALKAAKIEHDSLLLETLENRGSLIADLFGNYEESLEQHFDSKSGEKIKLTSKPEKEILKKIANLQVELEDALSVRWDRLLGHSNHLRRGSQFMHRLRDSYKDKAGVKIDRKG